MPTKRPACSTCPWRKSTRKRGFRGGYLDVVGLRNAVVGTDPAMACHAVDDRVCVGFAVRVGRRSPSFQFAEMLGRVDGVDGSADKLLTLRDVVLKHGGQCPQRSHEEAVEAMAFLVRE